MSPKPPLGKASSTMIIAENDFETKRHDIKRELNFIFLELNSDKLNIMKPPIKDIKTIVI